MRARMFGFAVAGLACLAAESVGSTPVVIELRVDRKSLSEQTGITCLPQEVAADRYRLAFKGTVASGPDAGKAVKGKVTLKRVEISD